VKWPRFSIMSVMWIVLIASVNLAAIRALETPIPEFVQILIVVSMPMASILLIGIPTLVKGFSRRGKTPPFLSGFEAFGWAIVLVCAGTVFFFPIFFGEAIAILWGWSGLTENRDSFWQSFIFFDMFIYLVPQLLIALAGSWLVGTFRIRVTVERRSTSQSEILS
jgi:hypothetical protein